MTRLSMVPVIIGSGEFTDKPQDPGTGLEPLDILERCARLAEQDVGYKCLRSVDTLRMINQISWRYTDLPGMLARRLRMRSPETIYAPPGGETPVRMLVDAAADIAAGESEVTLLCGAEAIKSAMSQRATGRSAGWTPEDPNVRLPVAEDYVSRLAARYGLVNPVDVYPLYENATRATWSLSAAEASQESADLWERMSQVAERNPYSWSGRARSAEEIRTPGPANRLIAHPYPKLQVAQIGVNQGAAVIVTHLEAARRWGVPDDRLIHIWSGVGSHEPQDFLRRDRYDHSVAMQAVLQEVLRINELGTKDIDLYELYSCFPCVPKLARRALGLPPTMSPSVTGGLSFFGGPGNNYMTHAICAMVRALRSGAGQKGLLYGNGEFVTKHHAAILATAPAPVAPQNRQLPEPQGVIPPLLERYKGPCAIETYTVSYTPKGEPDRGTVVARTPKGERVLGRVTDPAVLDFLVDPAVQPIGRSGVAYDNNDGLIHFGLQAPDRIAECPLRFERSGEHVAIVTLNRPDRRNAINDAVTRLLADYHTRVDQEPQLRVAILTAAPGPAFCGGADLSEVAAGHQFDMVDHQHGFAGFVNAKRNKPWIAAVRGPAVGGGMEILLACDLVVAGESASFALPEVHRGLLAAAGGAYRLPRRIPMRMALEYLFTGEPISASRALELHLVNYVVPDADVMGTTLELAQKIAKNAPLAVAASRKLAADAFDDTDAHLSERSLAAIAILMNGEDAKEGVRAFLEKRPARWKGV